MNSSITTHVLDTSLGRPAQGVGVTLEMEAGDGWRLIGQGSTDPDGRLLDLVATGHISEGKYRLRFDTGAYFAGRQIQTFYPMVEIIFQVRDASIHHHVPLLLSPYGYTTYRGS